MKMKAVHSTPTLCEIDVFSSAMRFDIGIYLCVCLCSISFHIISLTYAGAHREFYTILNIILHVNIIHVYFDMYGFHIRIHIYIHIAKSERANVNDWISPNAHNLKLWWMNAIRKESGAFLSQKHTYTHTDNIMIIIIITTTIMEYIYVYLCGWKWGRKKK